MSHPTLSASKFYAILEGVGSRSYLTPLQLQQQLLGKLEPEHIDRDDPDHPANDGLDMEAGILKVGRRRYQSMHQQMPECETHRIEAIYLAEVAADPADPIGGLKLTHSSVLISCHPDAVLVCHSCRIFWLADMKHYAKLSDRTEAKDEVRVQLAIGQALIHDQRDAFNTAVLEHCFTDLDGYLLSECALVLTARARETRLHGEEQDTLTSFAVTVLEVQSDAELRDNLILAGIAWMRAYVLSAQPKTPQAYTLEDLGILFPREAQQIPPKEIAATPELARWLEEYKAIDGAVWTWNFDGNTYQATNAELERLQKELEFKIKEAITDAAYITDPASGKVIASCRETVKELAAKAAYTVRFRPLSLKVAGINKDREKAARKAAKENAS